MTKPHKPDPAEEAANFEDTLHSPASETASGHEEDRTVQDVRQGHTGDHVRYVLGISFALVVVALFAAYFFFVR